MGGWIKLHRSILNSKIWDDPQAAYWWIDLLLLVNHEDKEIFLNGRNQVIKRGEHHTSINKLAERWHVNKKTVRNHLADLERAHMITSRRDHKGTTIKVCNYAIYQDNYEGKKTEKGPQLGPLTEPLTEPQRGPKQEEKKKRRKEEIRVLF